MIRIASVIMILVTTYLRANALAIPKGRESNLESVPKLRERRAVFEALLAAATLKAGKAAICAACGKAGTTAVAGKAGTAAAGKAGTTAATQLMAGSKATGAALKAANIKATIARAAIAKAAAAKAAAVGGHGSQLTQNIHYVSSLVQSYGYDVIRYNIEDLLGIDKLKAHIKTAAQDKLKQIMKQRQLDRISNIKGMQPEEQVVELKRLGVIMDEADYIPDAITLKSHVDDLDKYIQDYKKSNLHEEASKYADLVGDHTDMVIDGAVDFAIDKMFLDFGFEKAMEQFLGDAMDNTIRILTEHGTGVIHWKNGAKDVVLDVSEEIMDVKAAYKTTDPDDIKTVEGEFIKQFEKSQDEILDEMKVTSLKTSIGSISDDFHVQMLNGFEDWINGGGLLDAVKSVF